MRRGGSTTEEQARRGYSLAQQLEALREHAAREGYEVDKATMTVMRRVFRMVSSEALPSTP